MLVTQVTPPHIDLYSDHGFCNAELGVVNPEAIAKAALNSKRVEFPNTPMAYRESFPDARAWNLSADEVRRGGALFNVYKGAAFSGIGLPMRLILWPGAGSRTAGFNHAFAAEGVEDTVHRHPVSDECLILWQGSGEFYIGAEWVNAQANDCVLAPCGVTHGHRSAEGSFFGGFASPAQLDLLIPTDYDSDGVVTTPESTELITPSQRIKKKEVPGKKGHPR